MEAVMSYSYYMLNVDRRPFQLDCQLFIIEYWKFS